METRNHRAGLQRAVMTIKSGDQRQGQRITTATRGSGDGRGHASWSGRSNSYSLWQPLRATLFPSRSTKAKPRSRAQRPVEALQPCLTFFKGFIISNQVPITIEMTFYNTGNGRQPRSRNGSYYPALELYRGRRALDRPIGLFYSPNFSTNERIKQKLAGCENEQVIKTLLFQFSHLLTEDTNNTQLLLTQRMT